MIKTDISWVTLSLRKNIELPVVMYEQDNTEYHGYYTNGTNVIVVASTDEEQIPSIIAHEFCHYLQWYNGNLNIGSDIDLFKRYSYNEAIRLYFRTQKHEMEALLFEYKHTKNYNNKFWLEGLVLPEELSREIEM